MYLGCPRADLPNTLAKLQYPRIADVSKRCLFSIPTHVLYLIASYTNYPSLFEEWINMSEAQLMNLPSLTERRARLFHLYSRVRQRGSTNQPFMQYALRHGPTNEEEIEMLFMQYQLN